ncbi:hypothetical protein JCM10213_002669 [Rhodosporidiobolus nylandii]
MAASPPVVEYADLYSDLSADVEQPFALPCFAQHDEVEQVGDSAAAEEEGGSTVQRLERMVEALEKKEKEGTEDGSVIVVEQEDAGSEKNGRKLPELRLMDDDARSVSEARARSRSPGRWSESGSRSFSPAGERDRSRSASPRRSTSPRLKTEVKELQTVSSRKAYSARGRLDDELQGRSPSPSLASARRLTTRSQSYRPAPLSRYTIPRLAPPPPSHIFHTYRTLLPSVALGTFLIGRNGGTQKRVKAECRLAELSILFYEDGAAEAVLLGSREAVIRALRLVERMIYEEQWGRLWDGEKAVLEDRGWIKFDEERLESETGVWLKEQYVGAPELPRPVAAPLFPAAVHPPPHLASLYPNRLPAQDSLHDNDHLGHRLPAAHVHCQITPSLPANSHLPPRQPRPSSSFSPEQPWSPPGPPPEPRFSDSSSRGGGRGKGGWRAKLDGEFEDEPREQRRAKREQSPPKRYASGRVMQDERDGRGVTGKRRRREHEPETEDGLVTVEIDIPPSTAHLFLPGATHHGWITSTNSASLSLSSGARGVRLTVTAQDELVLKQAVEDTERAVRTEVKGWTAGEARAQDAFSPLPAPYSAEDRSRKPASSSRSSAFVPPPPAPQQARRGSTSSSAFRHEDGPGMSSPTLARRSNGGAGKPNGGAGGGDRYGSRRSASDGMERKRRRTDGGDERVAEGKKGSGREPVKKPRVGLPPALLPSATSTARYSHVSPSSPFGPATIERDAGAQATALPAKGSIPNGGIGRAGRTSGRAQDGTSGRAQDGRERW